MYVLNTVYDKSSLVKQRYKPSVHLENLKYIYIYFET